MKVDTRTNFFVLCSVSLACLMLSGCFEEQSYSNNRQKYSASMPVTIDGANYALVVDDALAYVDKHSTERMKKYISRGKLAAGMNQKEVIACLHATNFRDGLPVLSKTIKSKYGKYETWIVGGSSGDNCKRQRLQFRINTRPVRSRDAENPWRCRG